MCADQAPKDPTTLANVLAAFRASSLSASELGTKFELLIQRYLQTDPLYADLFSNVWRWTEWPGREGEPDTGIDLVAEEVGTAKLWAIQCKFYAAETPVSKADVDTFLSASGKASFGARLIVTTTEKWGSNAEAAIQGQQVPVQRLGPADLAASPIDWAFAGDHGDLNITVARQPKNTPRPHQREAIDDVLAGIGDGGRGKLIMACGTGKTFTALRLAEDLSARTPDVGLRVLFLVPSISLLSQTLREWTAQTTIDLRAFAVCSDRKVGKSGKGASNEDLSAHELQIPATTDPTALASELTKDLPGAGLSVVFSTYQSIDVIHRAQKAGAPQFDLVVCDEAHRSTGATLAGEDESHFVRVHDENYLAGARRLYMTATPRIFGEATQEKAEENKAVIASMDDESLYGPELHRLGFGTAVERGLLTDYKVLVLAVSGDHVTDTLQRTLAGQDGELNLDDAARIVGCWNGLAKRTGTIDGGGFETDPEPMRRAVAFLRDIKSSKQLAATFPQIIDAYSDEDELECEVRHVDGTFNALERNERLEWLKAPIPDGTCRILSNARCLSEGVDVPELDAVLFMHPRNSEVDVVQSVGRVMRRGSGTKRYGYIVLPIAIPAGSLPEDALHNNQRFRGVWQVLQALRAHDDRFDALVNKIDLDPKAAQDAIKVGFLDGGGSDGDDDESKDGSTKAPDGVQLQFSGMTEWRDAVYAQIVKKVGTRTYWEDWARDVADIAAAQQARIRGLLTNADSELRAQFDAFVTGLRGTLNDAIGENDAIVMLSQHLITKPVFDALFADYAFADQNPVSLVMQKMVDALDDQGLEGETERLEGFYRSVRIRAEGVENAEGKQRIIAELYERFFRTAFKATAESLGIVYTPVELVDFILRAADEALRTELGMSLSEEGVHVLDPFTGTGTFITRLLQSELIAPDDLERKYRSELHANEILLLAYYIAAVNIEATYHGIRGGSYEPFEGIALTDTFQITEEDDTLDTELLTDNTDRIQRLLATDVKVIVGNPPYSVGQTSDNDQNQNLAYPTLDKRIEETYAARSTAGLKRNLYDSYVRALRWASDRVGDAGVVAFVTNGYFIDGLSFDGLRKSFADDFSAIWCLNLRGNHRGTQGDVRQREGGGVFSQGSRAPVAITILVKSPGHTGPARLLYRDIGDYLTREQKLAAVAGASTLSDIEWETIVSNDAGEWIDQRDPNYTGYAPIGERRTDPSGTGIFDVHSLGLVTNRDAWTYNFSVDRVRDNIQRTVSTFNDHADRWNKYRAEHPDEKPKDLVAKFVDTNATRISWTRALRGRLGREVPLRLELDETRIVPSMYRPFCKQNLYFSRDLNEMVYRQFELFPAPGIENLTISVAGTGSRSGFSTLIVDSIPNLHMLDTGSTFARWRYEQTPDVPSLGLEAEGALVVADDGRSFRQLDNIRPAAVEAFRAAYSNDAIDADAIFNYIYGLLHHPTYRERYAGELRRMLPRIPFIDGFDAVAAVGRSLADLHLSYETITPWALAEELKAGAPEDLFERYRVKKMRHPKKTERDKLVVNPYLTLTGIPDRAHDYVVNGKSALGWIIDRYQVRTDTASQITNDPNDWAEGVDDPRYIVDLVGRVVSLSIKTLELVDALPEFDLLPGASVATAGAKPI